MSEKSNTLVEFAEQVADEMGEEWKAEGHRSRRMVLVGPQGGKISITGDGYNWEASDRVKVFGIYPTYEGVTVLSPHNTQFPKISVAVGRGAAAVAKAIQRRFLPKYWPLVERASKLVVQYAADNGRVLRDAGMIAQTIDGQIQPRSVESGILCKTPIVRFRCGGVSGAAQVQNDAINLSIRYCSLDLVLQLLEIVGNYGDKNTLSV